MKPVFAFVLLTMLGTLALGASPAAHSLIGRRAPQFVLRDSAGGKVALSEMQHGSVIIVTALASWSPLCRATMPELVAFAGTHPELAFVGVAVAEPRGSTGVQAFISRFQVPFPIAMGDGTFERVYHTSSVPTAFVIDRQGVIRAVLAGREVRVGAIQAAIRELAP